MKKVLSKRALEAMEDYAMRRSTEWSLNMNIKINNITSDDVYTSPMKEEKVSTINDLVYYESGEHST